MKKLKQYRKDNHMTVKEIAAKININDRTYSSYENGYKTPSLSALMQIADKLDLSMDYLLDRTVNTCYSFPESIKNISDACSFLRKLNAMGLIKDIHEEDKIIAFASLLHSVITNFKW